MNRLSISSVVAMAIALSPAVVLPRQVLTRVVYVSAVDRAGEPVSGLSAADFTVKEAGRVREVVSAAPAKAPMKVAILVDDNGTGIFRAGIVRFIQRLHGRAEFSLSTVTGQVLKLVDFTTEAQSLVDAIQQTKARPGTPDGGQLLEGIYEAARDFEKRRTDRPVIVALTVGGEEHSTLTAHHALEQLRKSGALMHVIAVSSSSLRGTVAVQKPAALLESNLNLSEVLGDGPKESGGGRDEIVATAGLPVGLAKLADTLINQYAVSFVQPDGVKALEKITVSVNKPGITVRAPARMRGR